MIQKTVQPLRRRASSSRGASCETSRERTAFVVTVTGEVDTVTVSQDELLAAVATYRADEPLDAVIDLSGVTFMDSAGLAWLVSLRSAATLADRKVRVRQPSLVVDKVLRSAGLRRYFPDELPLDEHGP